MYLLHFAKGSITLGELKQVRYVNHHRVYFEYYSHKAGPIQCRNCQQYGHGEANCFRVPVCVKCAEPHVSNKLRCANCGEHHTASFHGCPARKVNKPTTRSAPKPSFQLTSESFPSLPQVSRTNTNYRNSTTYANQLNNNENNKSNLNTLSAVSYKFA